MQYIYVDQNDNVCAISETKIRINGCKEYQINDADKFDASQFDGLVRHGNKIIFDKKRFDEKQFELKKQELRTLRKEECFSVINRGMPWYERYVDSEERKNELDQWYNEWLDVTETLNIPNKPDWIF